MNKKDLKVITINGFASLLLIILAASLFLSVLIVAPIWFIKEAWNFIIYSYLAGPAIGYLHAFLLWLMIVLLTYAASRNFVSINFYNADSDDDEVMDEFLNHISEKEEISDEDIKKFEDIVNSKK